MYWSANCQTREKHALLSRRKFVLRMDVVVGSTGISYVSTVRGDNPGSEATCGTIDRVLICFISSDLRAWGLGSRRFRSIGPTCCSVIQGLQSTSNIEAT